MYKCYAFNKFTWVVWNRLLGKVVQYQPELTKSLGSGEARRPCQAGRAALLQLSEGQRATKLKT